MMTRRNSGRRSRPLRCPESARAVSLPQGKRGRSASILKGSEDGGGRVPPPMDVGVAADRGRQPRRREEFAYGQERAAHHASKRFGDETLRRPQREGSVQRTFRM